MKAFAAFSKKELLENLRTYKLIIMPAVFILLGIMSPMLAKMLPDIMSGVDLGGMIVDIPEPAAIDSWTQFFSNIGQMGILTMVIVFCGIMSNEFSRGTIINILTKGIKRSAVIFSKFTVACVIWTASYLLSLAVCYAYTVYFWGNDPVPNALLAFAGPWLYGLLLISFMILGGILFKTFYGSLLITGGAAAVMGLLNIAPGVQKYNPASLAGDVLNLLNGQKAPSDFIPALVICAVMAAVSVTGSVLIFNRRQI